MRTVLVLLAATGCNQLLGVDEFKNQDAGRGRDDAVDDGAPDTLTIDAPPPPCNLTAPFGSLTEVTQLNSAVVDTVLDVSPDGNTVYIESDREGAGARMYTSTFNTGNQTWGALVLAFDTTPNYDVFSMTVGPDQLHGVIASNFGGSSTQHMNLIARGTTSLPFTIGAALSINSATGGTDATPQISRDGTRLYFDSDRDATNDRDLFQIDITNLAAGTFGTQTKLVSLSQGTVADVAPALSADQRTIYFASTRSGGGDVYTATRGAVGQAFTDVAPISGYNTAAFEAPGTMSYDGCTLYVNRIGTSTAFDVFVARKPAI